MRQSLFALGLAALAEATPLMRRQAIDLEGILADGPPPSTSIGATPTTISVNPTILASSAAAEVTQDLVASALAATITGAPDKIKRQDSGAACSARPAQPLGAGPVPSPDNASAFLAFSSFSQAALAAPTPTNYVAAFINLQAENNAAGYMGYTLLDSYDTNLCASKCSAIQDCNAFNIGEF